MTFQTTRRHALMLGGAVALMGAPQMALAAGQFWLVPPNQKLDAEAGSSDPPAPQAEPDAPEIVVEAPKASGGPIKAPVNITLKFVPAAGAHADPASFKVAARILGGWMDVTGEIRKRAKIQPAGVQVAGAMLPKGKHKIRLQIKDDKGRMGESILAFEIA